MKPMNGRLVKPNPMKPGMGQGPKMAPTQGSGKTPTKPGMPGPKPAPKAPGGAGIGQRMMGQPMPKKAALQKRLGR